MYINIDQFRQILFWPIAAKYSFKEKCIKSIDKSLSTCACRWEQIDDGLHHLRAEEKVSDEQGEYQEFVYFHEFVRRFLYASTPQESSANQDGSSSSTNIKASSLPPALSIYRRDDVKHVQIVSSLNSHPIQFSVDRIRLYLFNLGVIILAVEISHDALALDQILELSDRFRRAYPPYWDDEGAPGGFPIKVRWLLDTGKELSCPNQTGGAPDEQYFLDETYYLKQFHSNRDKGSSEKSGGNAASFVAPHWRQLLCPLKVEGSPPEVEGCAPGSTSTDSWRHLSDERIPIMTYIASHNIHRIPRKDWARLCFVDGPGPDLPYEEKFLSGFEDRHSYERYWPKPGTRYMFSDCGMVMATKVAPGESSFLEPHFRRHYFQMGLVVHFQKATLLAYSSRISNAVQDYEKEERQKENQGDEKLGPKMFKCFKRLIGLSREEASEENFEMRITQLRRELLRFTHLYWFTGVTNHIQGLELYKLWRQHLGVQEIYEEVANEIREADDFITLKRSEEATSNSNNLAEIATVGLPLALAIGFLGINLLIDKSDGWRDLWQWFMVFVFLATFCLFGVLSFLVSYHLLNNKPNQFSKKKQVSGKALPLLCLLTFVFSVGLLVTGIWHFVL